MTLYRVAISAVVAALLLCGLANFRPALAQSNDQTNQGTQADDETNLDTQLYLVVGTNQDLPEARMPASLEPVIRQLRNTLPFKNYRVSATLINRVKNNGRLNLKWIGGPLLGSAADSARTPSFNEFRVNTVTLVRDESGQQVVRMEGFSFGSRIPIQSGTAIASNGPAAPIITYESTGLTTDISMREAQPVIVGTVNVGPSGEAIILVMSATRTAK